MEKIMANMKLMDYYQLLQEEKVIMTFMGELSHEILASLAEVLQDKLSSRNIQQKITRRVFSIFVELTQNIHYYSAERSVFNDKDVGIGVLIFRDDDDHYSIISGNRVKNSDLQTVVEQCKTVNSLDRIGLKRLYKERLHQPRKEGQIGGGVGLIDMARKSNNPVEYETSHVDADHSFLMLSVRINKGI